MMKNKKIAIIGLGYVGLPLAMEFDKSREVVGYDIDTKRIEELQNNNDVTLEVTSNELKNLKNTMNQHLAPTVAPGGPSFHGHGSQGLKTGRKNIPPGRLLLSKKAARN